MRHGHCTGKKRERPLTEREQCQLRTLTEAIWAQIGAAQALEALTHEAADALRIFTEEGSSA